MYAGKVGYTTYTTFNISLNNNIVYIFRRFNNEAVETCYIVHTAYQVVFGYYTSSS